MEFRDTTSIMENQMGKNMENDMESGFIPIPCRAYHCQLPLFLLPCSRDGGGNVQQEPNMLALA